MRIAAVIIDKWKLPIFSRHLRQAGYSYDTGPGITANTHTLKVECEGIENLKSIIEAAQQECATAKNGGAA